MTKLHALRAASACLLVGVTAVVAAIVPNTPAQAVTLVQDPDRSSTASTGWNWYTSQTPTSLTSALGSTKRLIDIEIKSVDAAGVPTMSALMVNNTGSYARSGWSWKTGLTYTGIGSTLGSTNRLLDFERYSTPSGIRYAIVYVPNTGAQLKTSGWFAGKTSAQVASILSTNGARLIDIDTYSSGVSTLVNGIWINNTGVDARASNIYYGVSAATLSSNITTSHHRILTMERRSNGTLDAVTVSNSSGWFYYFDQSVSQISATLSQLGTRLYRLEPVGTTGTYDVLMLENANAETIRIRELARTQMGPYSWGFYVKKLGGSSVASLQSDTTFEPASAIKVLHLLAELRLVASGADTLGTRMDWFKNPDRSLENAGDGPGTCPDYTETSTNAVRTSVRQGLYGMMWDSDNRLTRGFTLKLGGVTALNSLASTIGMTQTQLNQDRIGCGWLNDNKNATTLRDLATLYEKATNGSVLSPSQLPNFIDLMINAQGWSSLVPIIDSEGASLGKSAAVIAAFKKGVLYYGKGGSYGTCPTPQASAPCGPPVVDILTESAVVSLPLPNSGSVAYSFGRFMQGTINCTYSPCTTRTNATAGYNAIRLEMLRSAVRSALAAW